jgi:hypothetical protein
MALILKGSNGSSRLIKVRGHIHLIMLLAASFLAATMLVAYTMDAAFWIESHLSQGHVSDNRETVDVAPYIYGKTPPISLGEIKNSTNAYFHLKLQFRLESAEAYPNVFQTAPLNHGIRMEVFGSTAQLNVANPSVSTGRKELVLTTTLNTGQWYTLGVEALNGSFVKVAIDGKDVVNYRDADISIETSQFLVGGGGDLSRLFSGEIKNISMLKGNLQLPHQSLRLVYITLLTMICLSFFACWKLLGKYFAVQQVFGKLVLLTTPLLLMLAYSEYRLSFLNSVYYLKRIGLEQQVDQVKVLVMGSSNTAYGIAPEVFSHQGYNLAFMGSGMFSDASLVDKYTEKLPQLRLVVLTANYFTMGLDYSTFSQSWRQFFLRQNFNVSVTPTSGLLYDLGFWFNPRNFSRIALYGDQAAGKVFDKHSRPVDIITTPSGWFDGGDASGADVTIQLGIGAAGAHNGSVDVKNYKKNISYWEPLIEGLQRKNIDAVIVLLPTDASYHSHLDKVKVELMNQSLREFSVKHHIKFVDYTEDPRFSLKDFTVIMPDHMNALGAKKFSEILDQDIIKALK